MAVNFINSSLFYWAIVKRLRDLHPHVFNGPPNSPDGLLLGVAGDVTTLGKVYRFVGRDRHGKGIWEKVKTDASSSLSTFYHVHFETHDILAAFLVDLSRLMPNGYLLRAGFHPDMNILVSHPRRWHASERVDGVKAYGGPLIDVPRRWIVGDLDKIKLTGPQYFDPNVPDAPDRVVEWMAGILPLPLRGMTFAYQFSSSAGLTDTDTLKIHIFGRTKEPIGCRDYHAVLQKHMRSLDAAAGVGTQIIYCSAPHLRGGTDPLEGYRIGVWEGSGDADLTPYVEAIRKQIEERESREPVERPRNVEDYIRVWKKIARQLGDDPSIEEQNGYHHPIYKMISVAVRHGETRLNVLVPTLGTFVRKVAKARGDLPRRQSSLDKYLSYTVVSRAAHNASRYWFGVDLNGNPG